MMSQAKNLVNLIEVFKLNKDKMQKITEQVMYNEEQSRRLQEKYPDKIDNNHLNFAENPPDFDILPDAQNNKKNKTKHGNEIQSDDIDGTGGFIEL
jgi:hypothetical protein